MPENTTTTILAGIAALAGAIGLPQLWKWLADSPCKKRLRVMELRQEKLITVLDMFVAMLEGQEEGTDPILEKVKQILKDEISEKV